MAPSSRRAALVVAAALLAAPAAAAAAPTATYDNLTGTLRVGGSTIGTSDLAIDRAGNTITIQGSMAPKAGSGCSKKAAVVSCTTTLSLKHVIVNLGDDDPGFPIDGGAVLTSGNDTVQLGGDLLPSIAGVISGDAIVLTGDGDDALQAGAASYPITVYGGAGNDQIATGNGNDLVYAEAGDDVIAPGPGNDQIWGGSGNDVFQSPGEDGSDLYDGGTDTPSATNPQAGDSIDYSGRTTALTAVLPADFINIPLPGSGALLENDLIAHVENVSGGTGSNTLIGNERSNALTGQGGSDTISGGAGDDLLRGGDGADALDGGSGADVIEARRSSLDGAAADDADAAIDCGSGDDTVARDYGDPATVGCEHDRAGFRFREATYSGSLNVGQTISLGQAETFGDPGAVTTTWGSCANEDHDDCVELGTGDTLQLTQALRGRLIYGYADVVWASGGDAINAPLSAPVGAPLPAPVTPTPAPAALLPAAAAPAIAYSQTSAPRAQAVVGLPVRVAPSIDLGEGIAAFEPEAFHQDSVLVSFNKGGATKILGISCATGCTVSVAQTAVEAPVPGKPASGKPKGVGLKSQTLAVAPGTAGAVTFTANAAQRTAIAKLKKPRLQVSLTVKDQAGATHTATKLYVLKSYAKKR